MGSTIGGATSGKEAAIERGTQTHPGSSRMKGLARSYVWWPKLDQTLEQVAQSCDWFQAHRKAPPEATLHPWVNPERTWPRLHLDFSGSFMANGFSSSWMPFLNG